MNSNGVTTPDDAEYGVRSYDGLNGERITPKPTLAMAQDYADYLRRISATRNTYGIRVELIMRYGENGAWSALTDEDAERIQQDAWDGLDQAMTPVIAAGLAQLAEHGTYRAVHTARPTDLGERP